jgi:hypothetical protein
LPLVAATDDDAIGMFEIPNCGALAQEFGVRYHCDIGIRPRLANQALNLVTSTDRHRGFSDNNGESIEGCRDLPGRCIDVTQIRVSVTASRRRADGNQHGVGPTNCVGGIGGKGKAPLLDIRCHNMLEVRLENRYLATLQSHDFVGVTVNTGDVVAKVSKASTGD